MRYQTQRAPGLKGVSLGRNIPWGSEELDQALLRLVSSEEFGSQVVWADRGVYDTLWSGMELHWAVNIDALLETPITLRELSIKLSELPYIPTPTELICTNIARENLSSAILDEVVTYLNPTSGAFLYVEGALDTAALKTVVSSSPFWTLRRKHSAPEA